MDNIDLVLADLREAYFYLSDIDDKEAWVHAKGVDLAISLIQKVKERLT